MIKGKNELFNEIENYSPNFYKEKVDLLDKAIDNSIDNIFQILIKENSQIHLAFSAGIDSSLILVKILRKSKPEHSVIAHTIGARNKPDIKFSQEYINRLKIVHTNLKHKMHIMKISKDDIDKSNEILRVNHDFPDNYYMLMKAIFPHTKKIVCCDCIDELLGGYYAHKNPKKYFPHYNLKKDLKENRAEALKYYMSKLIPEHLFMLDAFSSHFNTEVFLPYGDKEVINCCSKFGIEELVDGTHRKKPIYDLARRNNIPKEILKRRKYGLDCAFNVKF